MTKDFKAGVLAAASIANEYHTTHAYRLDDCITMKLNVVRRLKPRRNKRRIEDPLLSMLRGVALALADVHRIGKQSTVVCEVAAAVGLTVMEARKIGVDAFDWRELKKAGVPMNRK